MSEFAVQVWMIILELAPWLLLGSVVAGALHVLLPDNFVQRHLTGTGGIAKAVALGVPLPLCSCGVIPAGLGIKMYRLGYYMYDLDKPVIDQIEQIRPKLADLAALNRELGIAAVYQTHSGSNIFGAPIWDLHSLVKDHPPREIGVALDVAHTTVEGGLCWPLHYNLMRAHLGATYVKDFSWVNGKVRWGPLGVGHAASRMFAMIHGSGFAGPISLHVEYLDRRGPDAVKNHVAAFRRDLETLHQWMSQ